MSRFETTQAAGTLSEEPATRADRQRRDAALVEQALRGSEEAFSRLYFRYAPTLARRLRLVLRHTQDVEDVLQTTFLEAHRSLSRHQRDRSFAAWLHRIAFHVTGKFLRSRRRRRWLLFVSDAEPTWADPQPADSAERAAADRQQVDHVFRAMERLPDKKRIALALHDLEGLGVTEIGELVGASPQTVWARVRSARKIVSAQLRAINEGGDS